MNTGFLGRSLLVTSALAVAAALGGCNSSNTDGSTSQAAGASATATSAGSTSGSPATVTGAAVTSSDTLANASPGSSALTGLTAPNPLGINLAAVAYYSPEQPFLNIVKAGGSFVHCQHPMAGIPPPVAAGTPRRKPICSWIRMAIRLRLPPLPRSREDSNSRSSRPLMNYNMPDCRSRAVQALSAGHLSIEIRRTGHGAGGRRCQLCHPAIPARPVSP